MKFDTPNVLKDISRKLEIQNAKKKDFVSPASLLTYEDGKMVIKGKDKKVIMAADVTEFCHEQISEKLDIPIKYYKRMMKDRPLLLAENINTWLRDNGNKYLLRCLKEEDTDKAITRAFLSSRYNCIDNYDLLFAALDAIKRMRVKVEIVKAEVTDRRFYLQVVCPEVEIQAEAFLKGYMKENPDAVGNGIISGFTISNSEIGCGRFSIAPRAVIGRCANGLVVKEDSFNQVHLGENLQSGEIIWSERTKQKNYELIISQVQDAVSTFLNKNYLGSMVEKIAKTRDIKLEHPMDAVQNICKELKISDNHRKNILDYFLKDGVHDASGILHAVTREAQNMDADMQYDVEGTIIGHVINISKFDKPFSKN